MPDRIVRGFPLFPLPLVALPHELVPLHIFEERYRIMFDELLESDGEFGIVWTTEAGARVVGCACKVEQVLERMEDGRMNVLVQGDRPFRLLRRIDDMPYPAGEIELLDEQEPAAAAQAGARARERYASLVERVTDSRPSEKDLEELDAYGMAATLDFALDAKQGLLEIRSEGRRLERLGELFSATIKRLDLAERAAERARSNGKLRF